MSLKIGNIMAIFTSLGTLWLFFQLHPAIMQTIHTIPRIGPGNPPPVRLEGCIALALIVLGVVCTAKLISAERTNDDK